MNSPGTLVNIVFGLSLILQLCLSPSLSLSHTHTHTHTHIYTHSPPPPPHPFSYSLDARKGFEFIPFMLNIPCCGMFVMCICGDVHAVNTLWGMELYLIHLFSKRGQKIPVHSLANIAVLCCPAFLSDAGFHPAPLWFLSYSLILWPTGLGRRDCGRQRPGNRRSPSSWRSRVWQPSRWTISCPTLSTWTRIRSCQNCCCTSSKQGRPGWGESGRAPPTTFSSAGHSLLTTTGKCWPPLARLPVCFAGSTEWGCCCRQLLARLPLCFVGSTEWGCWCWLPLVRLLVFLFGSSELDLLVLTTVC